MNNDYNIGNLINLFDEKSHLIVLYVEFELWMGYFLLEKEEWLYSFDKHLFKVTNTNTITTSMDVNLLSLLLNRYLPTAQLVFTCLRLAIETLKQGVKYVQR